VGLDTPPLVPELLELGKLTSDVGHVQSNGDHSAACHSCESFRLIDRVKSSLNKNYALIHFQKQFFL